LSEAKSANRHPALGGAEGRVHVELLGKFWIKAF